MTALLILLFLLTHTLASLALDELKPEPRWGNSKRSARVGVRFSLTLTPRYLHFSFHLGCTILAGSLVCFGGETSSGTLLNDIYKLDLQQAWEATQPKWRNIQTPYPVRSRAYFGSAPCWNTGFIVDGGATELDGMDPTAKNQSISTANVYHVQGDFWSKPVIKELSTISPR